MTRRIGRGLAALLGDIPDEVSYDLSLDQIIVSPFQPRSDLDEASLDELTASVARNGILQPILVRPIDDGRFEIIAGERRWRAAQRAGLARIPALIRALGDQQARVAALVENLMRSDLNPIEEALGYRRLADEHGLTQDELAESIGKSRSHVANTLRLLGLSAELQTEVRKGRLSAGHARALLADPSPEASARKIISDRLSVRQTEDLVKQNARSALSEAEDDTLSGIARSLEESLGVSVRIRRTGQRYVVQLSLDSDDQLNGLVRRIAENKDSVKDQRA